MLGDIGMHREHFSDWSNDWIYDDSRLNLLRGPDETFLRLLCEMIHPIVRPNEAEVDELLALFNEEIGSRSLSDRGKGQDFREADICRREDARCGHGRGPKGGGRYGI
jgi:hypothetical protein